MSWASNILSSWLPQREDRDDIYIAAALHGFVDKAWQSRLETVLFASSRDRLRWAGAPFTPPSVLAALARRDETRLNRRLARHERTPTKALERIKEVGADLKVLSAIAAHRNASADLLRSLPWSESPAILTGLAGNPACPTDVLNAIFPSATTGDRKLIAANSAAGGPLLRALWEIATDDSYLMGEVAANPDFPRELHDEALRHHAPIVRRKFAGNPNIRTADLIVLLDDPIGEVRAEATRHAPTETIAEDEHEPARAVRRTKARRHDLPKGCIEKLAKDDDAWVRRWLARNPSLPADALADLAKDRDHEVRRGVARNPRCPKDILVHLACDPHPWVRAGVTFRSDIDGEMIELFALEENVDVLSGLGRNGETPTAWLARIAVSDNPDLRRSVILNARAPRELLRQLAEDPYVFNRVSLLKNPSLPADTVLDLLSDPEPQVRFLAASRLAREGTITPQHWQPQRGETPTILPQHRPLKSMGIAR